MSDAILIGYDGSPAADHAVRSARALLSARVAVIATVWEPALPVPSVLLADGVATESLDPLAAQELDELSENRGETIAARGAEIAREAGFETETLCVPDARNVAETLCELAAERHLEAIVVGSKGHSRLHDRLLGSTSSSLLHRAACPVLVVPAPRD